MSVKAISCKKLIDIRRTELVCHADELEVVFLEKKSVLDVRKIISNSSAVEPEDHQVDAYLDEVDSLEKFTELLREQMLVLICGYFEVSVLKLAEVFECRKFKRKNDLASLITGLSSDEGGLNIVDLNTKNTLDSYRLIRNKIVHNNHFPSDASSKLSSAAASLKGVKICNAGIRPRLELDRSFVKEAISVHFSVLNQIYNHFKDGGHLS